MTSLSLELLGTFRATLNGTELAGFRTNKVQALLIYLSVEQRAHRRESLMELLWPGMPERSARQNLRQILFHLRSAISEVAAAERLPKSPRPSQETDPLILANRQTIELDPAADVEIDALRLEALVDSTVTHEHLELLLCDVCRENLESAVALYRGNFLAEFYLDDSNEFEDWAQRHREAYRRKALDALEILATIHIRQGEFAQAQSYAERQLAIDNLREGAYRQLMEILALSGHREEALGIYEKSRRILAEELGMAPARRTTEMYEQIAAGELTLDSPMAQGIRGYELREEIGKGAYGAIYRAIQPGVGREVAVKLIRRRYANDPEFIRRFEAEAQMVAQLEHPHIVPLYDYWRDPDGAYLVMRYVRGGSLLSSLESGPWEAEPAGRMLEQVAAALSAAHSQGIVHRDVKPANILLDEAGNAFVSDFGVAKDLGATAGHTLEGAVIGTPDYISPEQILNREVGPQTDVYSLGAVLYETLTGEKLFPDSSVANLIHKHLNEPVPLVSESRNDVPSMINEVIQRAMAKSPADRYANAMEMAVAFRHAIGKPAVAPAGERVSPAVPAAELYNPYKGLQAFQEADADDFFGREALVEQLIARLSPAPGRATHSPYPQAQSRLVAVVGPSGSGKSSAVKAGLIPALREGAIPAQNGLAGSDKWFIAEMAPGTHPLEELEAALWPIAVDAPPSLIEPMQRDTRGMLRTIRRILPDEAGAQLLLIIDQFEELFTLVEDEERRSFFIDSLLAAVLTPRSPLHVVITLRADFYDRPLQVQTLGRMLKENSEIVLPLTLEELTWTVREPARRMGVRLEDGLVETIVSDVADQPGALPLLQYALTELFEKRQDDLMTARAYAEIGGVLGALGGRAKEIYDALDEPGKEATRQLFLRLVTLGEGVEDTRRRVLRSELEALERRRDGRMPGRGDAETSDRRPATSDQSAIDNLQFTIDNFGAARLLTFDRDPSTRAPTVEVAHEALLREWGLLRSWLDESRNDIRMQRLLAQAAAEWEATGQEPGFLLRGGRLDQFAGWAESATITLTGSERGFLEASIAARDERRAEEEERRRRELETVRQLAETEKARAEEKEQAAGRLRRRAAMLAGALVLAVLLTVLAISFARQSSRNAEIANENASLAQANADLAATSESEAVAEAEQRATAEAAANLEREAAEEQASLATSRELALAALNNLEADPELTILLALQALDTLYTKEAEEALHQGIQASRVLKRMADHTGIVYGSIYSPDGSLVATVSDDDTVKVWEAVSGRLLHTMPYAGADFLGQSLVFDETSNEVTLVALGEEYQSVILHVWHAGSGELLQQLELPISVDRLGAAALSPDRQLIAAGREDGTIELWEVATAKKLLTLSGHDGKVGQGVSFSRDGSRLVTASWNGQVQVWDLESSLEAMEGQVIASFTTRKADASLVRAYFNPDGTQLALGYFGDSAEVWDLADTSQPKFALSGSTGWDIAFHPDDIYLATGGDDAKVWDLTTGEHLFTLSGHHGTIRRLDFSPDGQRLLTGADDGTARIWDIRPYAEGEILTFSVDPPAFDLELSPDERKIALGSDRGPATVWNAVTGEHLLTLPSTPDTAVYRVAFNPDGSRLATVGEDGLVRIWDAESGELLHRFTGHTEGRSAAFDGTLDVEFSPDGSQLATAGADKLAKVWDVETGEELLTLAGHSAGLVSLEYSPDGRYLATSSDSGETSPAGGDTSVKVWDAHTGEEVHTLGPNPNRAWGLAFSPDGTLLATAGSGGFLRVWDMTNGEEVINMTGQSGTIAFVAFAPDGQRLVTGGDISASVWDIATGTELVNLAPVRSGSIALSRDGRRLFASDLGANSVRVYTVQLEDVVTLAQSRLTRSLTTAECRQYLHVDVCPDQK